MTKNILFAGFGGQGILFSGKIAAYSGLLEGAAQDAASRMRSALTVPADLAAAAVGTAPAQSAGRSLTITIGDVIVNGSSVQDVDELADLVVQKITRQVRRKEAAYGLV